MRTHLYSSGSESSLNASNLNSLPSLLPESSGRLVQDEAAHEWAAALIDRDGNRFPIYGVNLVKVRDGKFTHVRAYFDPTQFPQPGTR
jgi:hypothetical protein